MNVQDEKISEEVTRKPKRFSIVRVLILLFIIAAIPTYLLLPALVRAREGARRAKCISNLRQIGMALKQYALDNNETLPFVYGDMEPYQAFGMLHPAFVSALEVFHCPSSKDKKRFVDSFRSEGNSPFSKESCKESLSYAYGHNKGKSWTEEAPPGTRIATDKYANEDYSTNLRNRSKPLNHSKKMRLKPPGRFCVRLDGSINEDNNLAPLEADPETDINAGNPDAKHDPGHDQTGADWWSDPPEKE